MKLYYSTIFLSGDCCSIKIINGSLYNAVRVTSVKLLTRIKHCSFWYFSYVIYVIKECVQTHVLFHNQTTVQTSRPRELKLVTQLLLSSLTFK